MVKLVIANWKMEKSDSQALAWCSLYKPELLELTKNNKIELVLCPSASFLNEAQDIFQNTNISLGSQDCGPVKLGNYTGDVSVLTLHERNIKYCIIGHNERRTRYCESNDSIAQKAELLLEHKIVPVLCVGETAVDRESHNTESILAEQILGVLEKIKNKNSSFCIAYEPVWAIGTGKAAHAEIVLEAIRYIKNITINFNNIKILYGGSIDNIVIQDLIKIADLDGYLLGKSSLDFQMLKKIVLSIG